MHILSQIDIITPWVPCVLTALLACSVSRVGGMSTVEDYTFAGEACLPIISAVLADIKNKKYPRRCFLNIDLPTNIRSHKVLSGGLNRVVFRLKFCTTMDLFVKSECSHTFPSLLLLKLRPEN